MAEDASRKRRRFDRVNQACNLCRSRKVKCDGNWPCTYCARRDLSDTCTFVASDQQQHNGPRTPNSTHHTPSAARTNSPRGDQANDNVDNWPSSNGPRRCTIASNDIASHSGNETAVPHTGQLLRDADGKAVFIGDCAPLSFLRAIRQFITTDIDPHGRFGKFCQAQTTDELGRPNNVRSASSLPEVDLTTASLLLSQYRNASSGMVDIFDPSLISSEMDVWSAGAHDLKDLTSAVFYLVLAIGAQEAADERAMVWFDHSRAIIQNDFCENMSIQVVQGHTLMALYMLRAFKPNAAYLFFSLAARSAYAIGLHRAEVNASFELPTKALRNRIWRSLRVFDLFISCLLGRPPGISDADDTHRRAGAKTDGLSVNLLEANLLLSDILEQVVVQVYSRKHISVKVAHFVSNQLKAWASTWLEPLMELLGAERPTTIVEGASTGALQVVSTYLYSITLLARPFLIYDVYDSLGTSQARAPTTQLEERNKKKFADGAIDAAITLVNIIQDLISAEKVPSLAPGVVSWLFASSLTLGLGMLGRHGLVLEEPAETSIQCLRHFGKVDPHARQYSSIVETLVDVTGSYIRKREPDFRQKLKQASSELFGLTFTTQTASPAVADSREPTVVADTAFELDQSATALPNQQTIPMNPLSFPWSAEDDQTLQDFLRPTGPNFDFAFEDSFFSIDDGAATLLNGDMT
ncbi:hypothetical protein KVT40_000306 [Elsinoe batatas]|uniref:Zn(2)-C6 fungal-type domain-containing protein n=1 Tax=Elsinoe batatas TaxID=2601811 RepID=A0A8K0L747_9PEZI|nr:hypothetical protein KVT40_000306 [Elsinoe batatas]